MGFLSDAKFAASSFLSNWMKSDDDQLVKKAASSMPVSSHLRGEVKRVWTIRKREFDKLRALRQNELNGDNRLKHKQRFFHTSMLTDLSEKTSTIRKIDEIEAQMSMQWWKTDRLNFDDKEKNQSTAIGRV
jgi:hypothetical protein